jgi:hypothetical protein
MGRQVAVVLYVVAMAAVIVGVDFVFFRNRIWERLTVNSEGSMRAAAPNATTRQEAVLKSEGWVHTIRPVCPGRSQQPEYALEMRCRAIALCSSSRCRKA